MKILFLAEPYMDLHLPIMEEMRRQGHDVTFIKDEHLLFDWHQPWRGMHDKLLMKFKASLSNSYSRYWKKRIKNNDAFNDAYDLLFAINGCCVHKTLIKHLKKRSPLIKTVLYLWDNSLFYDYFHNAHLFDKVATFDYNDHKKYGARLLPFYWLESEIGDYAPKYWLSTVGSNHDGRLDICRKIYQSLASAPDYTNSMCIKTYNDKLMFKILDTSIPEDNIVIHKKKSIHEILQIIKESNCILDTDRESQSGTTPRLIWALAMGKKVVTTNKNIINFNFYSPQQILIIDRNNPEVPVDFISQSLPDTFRTPNIDNLKINRWVNSLINE